MYKYKINHRETRKASRISFVITTIILLLLSTFKYYFYFTLFFFLMDQLLYFIFLSMVFAFLRGTHNNSICTAIRNRKIFTAADTLHIIMQYTRRRCDYFHFVHGFICHYTGY